MDETASEENVVPMWYLLLSLLCIAGIAAIFFYVLPSVATIYEEIGRELPRASQLAIGLGKRQGALPTIVAVFLSLMVGFVLAWRIAEPGLRRAVQAVFLVPVVIFTAYLFAALVMPLVTVLQDL